MKALNTKPNSLILFTVLALAMSGCGKSNNEAPVVPGGIAGQYGYPGGTAGGALGSACTPLNSPISFQGAMYIDSSNVYAGAQMPAQTGTGYGTQYGGAISMTSQNSYPANAYGMITIQAQMISSTMANAGGTLQMSQAAIQQAAMQSGLPYGQIPCAQVSAIQLTHYNTTLYGGQVQILINGSIPYILYF